MSPVFHIDPGVVTAQEGLGPDWSKIGLTRNPFPESGVLGSILYTAHMPDVFNRVGLWLNEMARKQVGDSRNPFVLEGTIGAGKTHLLADMEKAFQEPQVAKGVVVVRENLVNAGGGRLLLSTLFGSNLRLGEIASGVLAADSKDLNGAVEKLPSASPIRAAFTEGAELEPSTLALWLRGAPLTKPQQQSVGGRLLDGEGERLRAVIHLLRLAALLGQLRLVVFLLDQLEDLERKSEITPLRRARFLTDLRIFIDEGLEGAPIALCTAWNTEGAAFMNALQAQYPALASRLGNRVTVPALSQTHLVPFAQAYLDDAYKGQDQNRSLVLDNRTAASLAGSLRRLPGGDVAPREWLDQLRRWAEREALRV
jgi:hypothetical protein